jgi:hypothetical protein
MPPQYREYEKLAIPLIKIINSKKSPKPDKTQASEMLGTLAAIAYNARRLGITFSKSQAEHQEFSASGVFDLVMKCKNGDIEIKEAKGGGASFKSCMDSTGQPVVQCTQNYNKVVARKMSGSKYNGKEPKIACAKHTGAPDGDCKGCVARERTRRRIWGKFIESAMVKGVLRKLAIRGNYKKTCPLHPSVITAYKVNKSGHEVPFSTPVF